MIKKKGGCRSKGSKSILQRDLVALIRKRNCRQISKSTPLILSVFRICNFQQKLEETLVFPCSFLKLDALLHPRINDFTFFNVQSLCSATRGNPGVGIDSNSCVNLDDIHQPSIMDGQVATNHFNMKKKGIWKIGSINFPIFLIGCHGNRSLKAIKAFSFNGATSTTVGSRTFFQPCFCIAVKMFRHDSPGLKKQRGKKRGLNRHCYRYANDAASNQIAS